MAYGIRCSCCARNSARPWTAAVAVWMHLNFTASVCESCLNHWLDNADDDPELEPLGIKWLDGSRSYGFDWAIRALAGAA
jgi:hypothetical protein